MTGAFVLCFSTGRELDLALEGIGLAVLDLAFGGEGNWVAEMDWAAWDVFYCWWG